MKLLLAHRFRQFMLSFLAGLALMTVFQPFAARADMLIMPVRLIFLDRDRMHDINLVNTDKDVSTFRIKLEHLWQNETGGYDTKEGPVNPEFDPAKMLMFSPRQVTLEPGRKQKIRVSLRRPPDLPDGDYRVHMLLQNAAATPARKRPGKGLDIQLGMNVGIAVPIIIRKGSAVASAAISNPYFTPPPKPGGKPMLKMTLTRSGTHSTMGKLIAYWTPPGESERQIGITNNVNVFSEITKREGRIRLDVDAVPGGTIRIVYEGDGPDKGTTFDELTMPVGG